MKKLNRTQILLFLLGGALMVISVGCYVFLWQQRIMCWIFLIGASLFACMQLMQTYEGTDPTVKRLKRIQALADILFVVAGILLVDNVYFFFRPLFANIEYYLTYLFNKWVIVLLIAAVLEVYTAHRIDHELSKKNIKE